MCVGLTGLRLSAHHRDESQHMPSVPFLIPSKPREDVHLLQGVSVCGCMSATVSLWLHVCHRQPVAVHLLVACWQPSHEGYCWLMHDRTKFSWM